MIWSLFAVALSWQVSMFLYKFKFDRKKPPNPRWDRLFLCFQHAKPRGRGPPMKNYPNFFLEKNGVVFQGGSSSSRLFIWKTPKRKPPPGRGVAYDQFNGRYLCFLYKYELIAGMTTENTTPMKSAESKNSDSSISRGTNSD